MEDTQKVGNVEMMISPIDHKNRPPRSRKRLSARGPVAEIGESPLISDSSGRVKNMEEFDWWWAS
jgi:hypothetical protein